MNKKIVYGIDIGSPSEHGGFCAWRWDGLDKIVQFRKSKGWYECVEKLSEDYKDKQTQVILGIEAPLFGVKDENHWRTRFTFDGKRDGTKFEELAWYQGAGAATALMAQEFLKQVVVAVGERHKGDIKLYENYISGLKYKDITLVKPDEPEQYLLNIKEVSKTSDTGSHILDSLEVLSMTAQAELLYSHKNLQKALKEHNYTLEKTQLPGQKTTANVHPGTFPLGLLDQKDCLFSLKANTILITQRPYYTKEEWDQIQIIKKEEKDAA